MRNPNEKLSEMTKDEIINFEFQRLQDALVNNDATKLRNIQEDIRTKFAKYKREYEPWSAKVEKFNKEADAHFAEDKEIKKRVANNPMIAELKNFFKALHWISVALLVFVPIYQIYHLVAHGWANSTYVFLAFFWIVLIARLGFEFYVECPEFLTKHKHKFPKDFCHKEMAQAFLKYDAYCSCDTLAMLFDRFVFSKQLADCIPVLDAYPDAKRAVNLKFNEVVKTGDIW